MPRAPAAPPSCAATVYNKVDRLEIRANRDGDVRAAAGATAATAVAAGGPRPADRRNSSFPSSFFLPTPLVTI